MGALRRVAAGILLLPGLFFAVGCRQDQPSLTARTTILRSFADEVTSTSTISVGRYRHAMASVQGLPVTGPVVYRFDVTLPTDAKLRFRPLLHPGAEACWASGPSLRVVLRRRQTDLELWSADLTRQLGLRTRLWVQAVLSRTLPGYSPRALLPPEIVLPLNIVGRGELRFEATGRRRPCDLAGWDADNGGHAITATAIWGAPVLQAPEFADRPDIILVVLDAVRADALSLYGGPARVPKLEQFAQDAVVFRRALTAFPMTRESTFSLMTGAPPALLGVPFWRWNLLPQEKEIASLRAAQSWPVHARRRGMRSVFAGNNGFLTDTVPVGYDGHWGDLRFFYKEPYDTNGTLESFREWSSDPQRMFAYLHFNQPHWPHKYDTDFPADDAGGFPKEYLSEIASADASFGQVIDMLRDRKRFDNSIVIVTADHGELFPEGEKAGHGTTLRPAEMHVPLLIRFPHGLYGGRPITDTASLMDVFPTVADYLQWGITAIQGGGRSLMPLVTGEQALLPNRVLAWEGKGVDGYTDGFRFYTAHQATYLSMNGIVPGSVEQTWEWPYSSEGTQSVPANAVDRIELARMQDVQTALRRHAWRWAGAPPSPPRALYVLRAAPGIRIETVPLGAMREVTASSREVSFHLVPPSATLRLYANEHVKLGPWQIPYGGRNPEIITDTDRRLLVGKPANISEPALWVSQETDAAAGLSIEVRDALRGWGYVH